MCTRIDQWFGIRSGDAIQNTLAKSMFRLCAWPVYFPTKICKDYLCEMCILVSKRSLSIEYIALPLDPFLGPCYWSLLAVVCDVISDAAAEEEEAIGWMFSSPRGERAKRAKPSEMVPPSRQQHHWWSRKRHQEGINSKGPRRGQ